MIKNNLHDKLISKIQKNLVTKEIEQLANSPSKDSKIFLEYQEPGKSIEKKKKMIVFYATSEHEHSPLLARKHIKFLTQYQAFEVLQTLCIKNDYQLIFKHHPPGKKNFFKRLNKQRIHDWKKVEFYKETIQLMPDSTVDTYQLIQDADINVTWGSTVGIESIAREKPTIIMGDQTWLNKEWGIHAWDVETLEILLKSNSYELKKEVLIPWFWFMQDYGESFAFVETENYNPSVNGVKVLQPRWLLVPFYKIAVKLKKIKII
jgi:CDP-glycerol glycerophosphotransferase (TagB/SpsB family)